MDSNMEKSKLSLFKTRDFFAWTDDEVELLLKVTYEYKEAKAAENTDWETLKSKYGDIFERYRQRYPSTEEAMAMRKDYPHKRDEVTKGQLTTKVKAIRFRYRQAVDSGRKSGHGRVVLLFFDLCESIWGESRAAQGISEVEVEALEWNASSPYSDSSSVPGAREAVVEDAMFAAMVANRCQRLAATMCNYRGQNLKRKLSMDFAAQDPDIKRQLTATEDDFLQTMGCWSSTMDRLNSNIELLMQYIADSDSWCKPLDEEDAENEEEDNHRGLAIAGPTDPPQMSDPPIFAKKFTQGNARKGHGHREIRIETALAAPATSTPDIKPEIQIKAEDSGSTSRHDLSTSTEPSVTQGTGNVTSKTSKEATSGGTPITVLVDSDNADDATSGRDELQKIQETRVPQASNSTQTSNTMEGSNSTDLDAMDLDQLKKEKIKMQLKVLRLQDEYYTLKVKELKK